MLWAFFELNAVPTIAVSLRRKNILVILRETRLEFPMMLL